MLTFKIKLNDIIESEGNILFALSETFTPITSQDSLITDKALEVEVNESIDYEKVKIGPVYFSDEEQSTPVALKTINIIPNFVNGDVWDTNGTKLHMVGVVEDDVKNRRKRLEKTFIRLAFYDSNIVTNQNLLYYSNVYIDSSYIYKQYLSGVGFNNIPLKFTINNPLFDKSNKRFEGFNLYLFKDDVTKNEIKTIYIKIEYNNAVNGSTSLFTKNKPTNSDGYTLNELRNEMFLPLKIKYSESLGKYIYWVDGNSSDSILNLSIYQAKVK